MPRAFLDANVLFSVAYRPNSGLAAIWELPDIALVTSDYALCEAARNLTEHDQRSRLETYTRLVTICTELPATGMLFANITLPDKDWPILLAAAEADCEFLITGDKAHFGPYFGKEVNGVTILTPRAFLDIHRTA